MNKIKLIYDMVKANKKKDNISGLLTFKVFKGDEQVFQLDNNFAKNIAAGYSEAKIRTELNYEGKEIKHESFTQFKNNADSQCHGICSKGHKHGSFPKTRGNTPQEKIAKLLFFLKAMDDLEVLEKENKVLLLNLEIKEIPPEIKELMGNKLHHHHMKTKAQQEKCHNGEKSPSFHDFHKMEDPTVKVNITLNANKEIEKAGFLIKGIVKDGSGGESNVKMQTDLSLI